MQTEMSGSHVWFSWTETYLAPQCQRKEKPQTTLTCLEIRCQEMSWGISQGGSSYKHASRRQHKGVFEIVQVQDFSVLFISLKRSQM